MKYNVLGVIITKANYSNLILERIFSSVQTKQELAKDVSVLNDIANVISDTLGTGKKLLLFGNGGSAADAQHLAAELVGKFYFDRDSLPAIALNVNTSCLTAIGNDYAYDQVFARQVKGLGNAGDIAIGITTSGNSPNVIEASRVAREKGMITIGLTGASGGLLKQEADYCICVPSNDTPRIQEAHILIGHIICEIVEQAIFGGEDEK